MRDLQQRMTTSIPTSILTKVRGLLAEFSCNKNPKQLLPKDDPSWLAGVVYGSKDKIMRPADAAERNNRS